MIVNRDLADFKKLKEQITLERVLREMFGIQKFKVEGKELRCLCPLCGQSGRGKRVFAANTVKNTFYCHACHKGGDIIKLVALKENCTGAAAGIKLRDFFQVDASYSSQSQSETEIVSNAPCECVGGDDERDVNDAEADLAFILSL